MSMYRIYHYENSIVPYKHVLLKGDRTRKEDVPEFIRKYREEIRRQNGFEEHDKKMSESLSRAKRNITELCLCNDFDYFCTFEFSEMKVDRNNLKDCYKRLQTWFKNFKNRYAPDFKYLVIPEFHPKTGAVHFHGLISGMPIGELTIPEKIQRRNSITDELEQVPNTRKYVRWERYSKSLGYFDCSPVKSRHAVAFYVTKYVTKELCDMPKGTHLYACSRSLKRPEMIYDGDDDYMLIVPTYNGDYCKIAYDKYEATYDHLDRMGVLVPFDDVGIVIDRPQQMDGPEVLPDNSDTYGTQCYNEEWEIPWEQTEIKT